MWIDRAKVEYQYTRNHIIFALWSLLLSNAGKVSQKFLHILLFTVCIYIVYTPINVVLVYHMIM